MTCPFCVTQSQTCQFCDKLGLPILPVRYAVARNDLDPSPKLNAPFGDDVCKIPLPSNSAQYTLRLLRPGYLYVYNEKRKEWSGYVVTNESFLFKFDVMSKTPPDVAGAKFTCTRKGDAYIARCITIPDAAKCGKVWLGFTDVAWTPSVLAKNESASYRSAHMHSIDVSAWLKGNHAQAHAAALSEIRLRIAEFARKPGALPNPSYSDLSALLGRQFEETERFISGLGKVEPFGFSTQTFIDLSSQANGFIDYCSNACSNHNPLMFGLADPAGIVMDLNALALTRGLEWAEEPKRAWKITTAAVIDQLKEAVSRGAVKSEQKSREFWAMEASALASEDGGFVDIEPEPMTQKDTEETEKESWTKYIGYYDDSSKNSFVNQYKKDLVALDAQIIKPLDESYLAWFKSKYLSNYFIHNYDPNDVDSGVAYQQVVYACLKDASGRTGSFVYFKQCLGNDPGQPAEVVLRGLLFNQDELIKKISEAAAEKGSDQEQPYSESISKSYDALKDIFTKGYSKSGIDGYLSGMANYIFQVGGPMLSRLGTLVDSAAINGATSLIPEKRLISILGALDGIDHPDRVMVKISGEWDRKRATRVLASVLSEYSGIHESALRSGARTAFDSAAGETGHFDGIFLIDKKKLQTLEDARANATRNLRGGVTAASALQSIKAEEFEKCLQDNVHELINAEAKAGVVGSLLVFLTLFGSYKEWMKADAGAKNAKGVNFGAAVMGFVGSVTETTGRLVEHTPWGVSKLARPITVWIFKVEKIADAVTTTGRLLGAVGGIITGGIEFYEGWEEREESPALGITKMAVGFGTAAVSILVLFGFLSAGIGLIIILVLAAAGWIISLMTPNDIQTWLSKCSLRNLAGNHSVNIARAFKNLMEEQAGLKKLAGV